MRIPKIGASGKQPDWIGHALLAGIVTDAPEEYAVRTLPTGETFTRQTFDHGAFGRALARGGDIEIDFNHGEAIGSVSRGDVQLEADPYGLAIGIIGHDELRDVPITGLSVRYKPTKARIAAPGSVVLLITDLMISHVAISVYPMQPRFPGTWLCRNSDEARARRAVLNRAARETRDAVLDAGGGFLAFKSDSDILIETLKSVVNA